MSANHGILLATVALHAGVAAAGPLEFQFAGQQCFHHEGSIAPAATLDICGYLPEGELVAWKFNARSDLETVIRVEGQSTPLEKHARARGATGQFAAPAAQRYCWSWHNPGPGPAPMAMELEHP